LVWDNIVTGYTFMGEEAAITRDEFGSPRPTNWLRFLEYISELLVPIAPGQVGGDLLDVAKQTPGAVRQVGQWLGSGGEEREEQVGPSPLERVIGGVAASVLETAGGRVGQASRSDWENMIAQQYFGKDYDDLDAVIRPHVDKLVVQEYGEQEHRGPKRFLRKEKDEIDTEFIESVREAATHLTEDIPNSPAARAALNAAQGIRSAALFGTRWDPEKERTTGGLYEKLYDRDEKRDPPEDRNSLEYWLWEYYQLVPRATNEDGSVDWELYNEYSRDYWRSLAGSGAVGVDRILDNIRVVEGEYTEEMQTMVDAGRYAAALKVTIDTPGGPELISYWDIEKREDVRQEIARLARAKIADVNKYMDANSSTRSQWRSQPKYEDIDDALKASRSTDETRYSSAGTIGTMKKAFTLTAPEAWTYAMIVAGYKLHKNVEKLRVALQPRAWDKAMGIDYDALYRGALKAEAQGVAVGAR
tara:strand:- start:40 stop:1458 length:1419 start_codon:yes stop_codon:yes gene_type:complete